MNNQSERLRAAFETGDGLEVRKLLKASHELERLETTTFRPHGTTRRRYPDQRTSRVRKTHHVGLDLRQDIVFGRVRSHRVFRVQQKKPKKRQRPGIASKNGNLLPTSFSRFSTRLPMRKIGSTRNPQRRNIMNNCGNPFRVAIPFRRNGHLWYSICSVLIRLDIETNGRNKNIGSNDHNRNLQADVVRRWA